MVLSNSGDNRDDSFTRRFIDRASIKKDKSSELPVILPKLKMNILYAINFYRFKDFKHKYTKLSDTAMNYLNKEILVISENCEKDVTIPSEFLEDEIFLKEFKNDIITKKCHNWNFKIDTKLNNYDDDLLNKIQNPNPIPEEKSNVDLIIERSEMKCKDNKNDEKNLTRIEKDWNIKLDTPYTRLNEEIKDLKEKMESLEYETYLMDTPRTKSFHSQNNSTARNSIELSKRRLSDYMAGLHKAFEDTSKETKTPNISASEKIENINEKLNKTCLLGTSECKKSIPVSVNTENVNKTIRKIEKPKRMKPKLESTIKSSSEDSSKKNTSFSIPSTISTITPIGQSKSRFEEKSDYKFSKSIGPLEMQKFLDNALNNESSNDFYLSNYTTANRNISTNLYEENVDQERIEDSKTISRKETFNLRLLASEPPPQNNINRISKMLRSYSQEISTESQSSINMEERQTNDPVRNHKDKIKELLQRLEVQQTLIHQASKALNLCNLNKTFLHSIQHVESERLLLLSNLKKSAVLNEIKQIHQFQDNNVSLYEHGKVTISQISLRINKDKIDLPGLTSDTCEWFMVTVKHESTVWATSAMNYSFDGSTTICFPESITVPNLSPDFIIEVGVHNLQLRNINSNEINSNITCPSPTKLWKKLERSRLKENEIQCSSIRETSFQLTGYIQLTLQDIHRVPPWPLLSVPSSSILESKIDFKLSRKIKISLIHSGFLTHGDEIGGFAAWNRRWCVLDGSCLKFWNYPQEHDLRAPLLIIDLTHCTSNEVQAVDRSICAKPRTLMFKTIRERLSRDENSMFLECQCSYTVVRHLISCDTIHDMMEWSSKLNYVLSVLSNWKSRKGDFIPTTELIIPEKGKGITNVERILHRIYIDINSLMNIVRNHLQNSYFNDNSIEII